MRSDSRNITSLKNVILRGAQFVRMIDMTFAHVGGNLDLRGATLSELDLAGASIAGDLRVGGGNDFKSALWTKPGTLNLHNVQCGNPMDAMDAWPAEGQLHLDGFSFTHLGGYEGDTGPEMRNRGMEWWDKHWARRDREYSPAPYAQLASALTAQGDRDAANEIRYLGRVRERRHKRDGAISGPVRCNGWRASGLAITPF
jgi:hypothetical protein